jgi:predicted AAA+ superfamily ATPase
MPAIPRSAVEERIRTLSRSGPVTALLGPRQAGKTTLARQVQAATGRGERYDLEDPRDLQRLQQPMTTLEELLARVSERDVYFWAIHAGAELDFLWRQGGRLVGFEAKWSDAPTMTKSMHVALGDLGLERLYVVYPGPRYALAKRVEVLPMTDLQSVLPSPP